MDGIESKKDDSSTAQSQIATIVAINRARVSEIESQLHESQKTVAMLSSQAELWQRAAKRSQDARIQAEASLRTLESQVTELTGELELAKQQKSELQQQQTHILQNSSNGGDGNTSSADKQMIQDLQLQLQEALTRNEALTEAMAEASNHIQALERENTDLLVQIELKSSTEKSAEDLYNQLEQERVVHEDELKKMVMQFEELIGGGESASIQLKTRIEELEADAAKSAADSLAHESNTNERISQLEALVAELESSVSNLSERKMELQEALDLSQQTVELLQTRSSSSSEVNPSTDRGVGDDNKEQFALKVRRIEELQAEVIAIHDSREAAEEAKAAAERTSNHLMEELQARDAELVQLHEQRASASAENEQQLMEIQRQLSMEIESLEQAVEEKNDEISQLNARINELQSVSSHREEMKVQLSDKEDQIKELIHEMKESNNLINLLQVKKKEGGREWQREKYVLSIFVSSKPIRFLLLQEEITSSQVELQQIKLNKARQEEDEKRQLQASKESLELEQQVSLLEIRLEESKQELDLVKEQMGEKAELVDEMKVKVSALESQLEKHQQQQQQQRSLGGGESKKEAAIKAAMASELASLHSSLKEYEDRLVSERQAKDSLSAQIESLTASLAQSQEMIEVLQADLADVGNERSAHGIDLEDISVQLNQLQDKYEQMEKSKVELSAEYEIKLKETANIMADMDLQVESLKTSIKELTEQLESEASQKSILADKIESLTDEICERDGAIVELRQKLDLSVSENNNSNSSKKKSSTKEKLSKVWRSGSNSKKSGSKSTTEPPTSPLPTEQLMSPTSEPSSPPLSPVSAPITNNDIEVKELQTQLHQVIETSRREQEGLVLQMQEREDDVRILESRVKVVESQLHSALDDLIKEQNEKKRVKAKLEEALSSQLQEGEEEDPSSVVDAKNQEESKLLDILKLKKQHRMTFDELSHVNAVVEDLQRRIEELEVQIQKERHLTDQAKQLAARMEQQANELLTENESMMLYNQQLQSKLLSLTNEE